MKTLNIALVALLSLTAFSAQASVANAEKLAAIYTTVAKGSNADFVASAADGKTFYNEKVKAASGKEVACASCHTANPANVGKHIVTGKAIKPLSPVVNANRFSDYDKVEGKFTKHCNDILGADCTPAQKANYITYLLTESTPTAKAKK
jgi:mono/diheme cytochrome c family protein